MDGQPHASDQLRIRSRNLPHWELGGSTYFLTYRCRWGVTLSDGGRTIVLENWRHWHRSRYLLHAVVVMPDHVHVLFTPLPTQPLGWYALETILHTNKSYTAHAINRLLNRRGQVWQDERYDRIVRDENEFWEKWQYITENPERSGLVGDPLEYPWLHVDPGAMDETGGNK